MKQLSVYVENQVGSMTKVTKVLKNANISVKAVSVFDSPDFSIVRFVVDDEMKAKEVLCDNHIAVRVTDVIAVCIEDKTGSLDNLLEICTNNNINIRYMYSFVYRGNHSPLLVMSTDNYEEAVKVFEDNKLNVITKL